MNEFKTMKFVRSTRDKIYEETKDKTANELRKYYKEKASWIDSSLKKGVVKSVKSK
jgi:DNA phosphorothioation-dependent restriction protein DptG